MNKNAPLLLVDDDLDDQEMISLALKDLGLENEIYIFNDPLPALKFLCECSDRPFLILSDINMPKMDGFAFKQSIDANNALRNKNIPFVFLSTASSNLTIRKAYDLNAHGFFEKGSSFEQLKLSLKTILEYWQKTKHPN